LHSISDTGYLHSYLPSEAFLYIHNNSNTLLFYLLAGCHVYLAIVQLRISPKEHKWLYHTGIGISLLFTLMGVLLALPLVTGQTRTIILRSSFFIIFILDVYVLTISVIGFQKKKLYVYFYLISFFYNLMVTTYFATQIILYHFGMVEPLNQQFEWAYIFQVIEKFFMLIGITFQFSTQNKQLKTSQKELQVAQKNVVTILDEEQLRIAKDLHDSIGQELFLLKQQSKRSPFELGDKIDAIIDSLRNVSRQMYPVAIEKMTLCEAIPHLCHQIMTYSSFFVSSEICYGHQLEKEKELQIYRIIQEGVNNAMKHSMANAIRIEITETPANDLEIYIKDDGVGFDYNEITRRQHNSFGLKTMSQRAKSLGGTFHINSSKKGTVIHIHIPFQNV
jgi:signal transduction histidine kinase